MIEFKNKNIYFSGHGEKCEKEELIKYFIQNEANMVQSLSEANMIIQGYMTPVHLEDQFYLMSKDDGIEVIEIEKLEKEFSKNIDIDSILLAIKISKENQRVIKLLKNTYFSDDIFIKILKYYNWGDVGIYDSDDNRDVATSITSRFCSLVESNHNIQHSPIGIYYTALEATNGKLLEAIYHMPHYEISDRNAKDAQPLTLKEVVALNPNTPKPVMMQIFKDGNKNELKFLASNESLNNILKLKLFEMQDKELTKNLILANNIEPKNIDKILSDKELKKELLKNIELKNEIFTKLIDSNLDDIEIVYLSSNPTLEVSQIDILFEKNIDNANINLLKHKACDIKQIKKFLNLNDKIYNIAIASNEVLDKDIYTKLSQLDDFDVDLALAYNSSSPKDVIKLLNSKNNHDINIALSSNSNTPINILMQLQVDNRYHSYVSENETYKEFSRNSLGIISQKNSQFKRNTYMDTV